MKPFWGLLALCALPQWAGAGQADEVRGGWVTDGAHPQIFMLIVRGEVVSGTYCVDCADPRNLAFVVGGSLTPNGVRFKIWHEDQHGRVTESDVQGSVRNQELVLQIARPGEKAASIRLHRPPASPNIRAVTNDEAETKAFTPGSRPPYVLPGPLESFTPENVRGVWLWGTGPGKQYFMIQRVGTQILGMVCGPCENPNNMAPLDGFLFAGTALTFNIVHEDTGAAVEHGPFNNVAHATLSQNEMHLKVVPSYAPPDSRPFEMTLLGPVQYR